MWYGTIGNGWGLSRDRGRTWRNWTFDELGPRWLYVAPGGIAAAGDSVYIATADGLRITRDGGETYRDVTEAGGLASRYVMGLALEPVVEGPPILRARTLAGIEESADGGRSWRVSRPSGASNEAGGDSAGRPPELVVERADAPLVASIRRWMAEGFRRYPVLEGLPAGPGERRRFPFRRPIGPGGNVHVDQTYTYGSTMGGNFQQHQGIEFNNPEGTSVLAAADGVVAFAGPAEAGSNTIAIRHDLRLEGRFVWSTYYHNVELTVGVVERVRAGDEIARVGSTGRATNDHLHFETHVTPTDSIGAVVDAAIRYPPHTVNPLLWIQPLLGTGVVAGRVFDAAGRPVAGARVYGIVKAEPVETPFSFAETYRDRAHPDPSFQEHFVIGDVPAGRYVLGVEIERERIHRAVDVAAGQVTEVELRPPRAAADEHRRTRRATSPRISGRGG